MSGRFCDRCGGKAAPFMPRTRVGDEMWCPMCAMNHRQAAAGQRHPDLDENERIYGAVHTSGGRILRLAKTGASHADQEARMADQSGWTAHNTFKPVRFAIEGARAYNSKHGLGETHQHSFDHVRQDADTVRTVGRLYDALPHHQPEAVPHFEAMRHEVGRQFDHLTNTMGVKVHVVDHDPYKDIHEMAHDLGTNKQIKVMGTHVTGGHPLFKDHENDQFRAVHDVFGHAATGRSFDRHGEQSAYLAHSAMFSGHARPAMASETKGQNTSLILNGHFGPQKIAVLPRHHWDDSSLRGADPKRARLAGLVSPELPRYAVALGWSRKVSRLGLIQIIAHDSGDGETIFHCPFCGSGQVLARSDGAVDCEFCSTAFTVQVQPQMPSFPQTIDGMPVQVPGMPAGGQNANVPPGGAPMDPMAPDDGAEGEEGAPPDGPPDEEEGEDDDTPAFLKGSYLTEHGDELSSEKYMRRLALQHARTPAVLAEIRRENGVA